jgi:predicted PolB exonuclease-like 3'-5' exonuclease
MNMIKYLVQDIETIPETELATDWEKEREKLEADGKANPFPPLVYHKVVTIGMLTLGDDLLPVKSGCAAGGCTGGQSEKEMISRWSSVVANGDAAPLRMIDWYGRGFDVPVLQTRAFRYGIPMSWYFGLQPDNRGEKSQWSKEYRDRYAGAHDDQADVWTNRGAFTKPHMADLARLMGLPGKIDGDGGKVYDQWKEFAHAKSIADGTCWGDKGTPEQREEWRKKSIEIATKIDTYCMQDVFQTAFIFQRLQYMAGKLSLERYQVAAAALLVFVEKADPLLRSKIDAETVLLKSV